MAEKLTYSKSLRYLQSVQEKERMKQLGKNDGCVKQVENIIGDGIS